MAAWLIAAIEHLPLRVRRIVVAAVAALLLAGAIASLTLEANHSGGASPRTPIPPARSRPAPAPARPSPPRVSPPVSGPDLRAAAAVARRFVLSYLQFAYSRAGGTSVKAVTPGLRGQLMLEHVRVTPAERS